MVSKFKAAPFGWGRASGFTVREANNPDGDIEIAITSLRPGEKLFEELSITKGQLPTKHPKIFVSREAGLSDFQISRALGGLRKALARGDAAAARKELMHWVRLDLDALDTRSAQARTLSNSPAAVTKAE